MQIIAEHLDVDPTELVDFTAPSVEEEKILLKAFRSMPRDQRRAMLKWAEALLDPERE